MIHATRTWAVADEPDAAALAEKLATRTWCLCQGFRHGGYLWLNDAFSENGAQEYAVVRERDGVQVESITASWVDPARMEQYVRDAAAGRFDADPAVRRPLAGLRVEAQAAHRRCRHCA